MSAPVPFVPYWAFELGLTGLGMGLGGFGTKGMGLGLTINTCRFHGDRQWVQYGEGGPQVSFLAHRSSEGTWPRGSQWTRNPIPACAGPWGGANEAEAHCFQENGATQFPPPGPGICV